MTTLNRTAPTREEIEQAARTALDKAEAEIRNARAHLDTGGYFAASRCASIVAGTAGTAADKLRDLAIRESQSLTLDALAVEPHDALLGQRADL